MINVRGVQLAAMFMHGVEHAVFVNDVAGSPLPLSLFCPWMFFDGKLFQYKLLKSSTASASLQQLCDNVGVCSIFICFHTTYHLCFDIVDTARASGFYEMLLQ